MRAAWQTLDGQERRVIVGAILLLVIAVSVLAFFLAAHFAPQLVPAALRPGPDRWALAVEEAQQTLAASPDFEAHLQSYRTLPAEVDDYLNTLERVRTTFTASDELRRKQIPLLGNAWQVLTTTLNVVPGAGQMLDSLDTSIRQVVAPRGRLVSIRDVDDIAGATAAFRTHPSHKTLLALRKACAAYRPALAQADQDMAAQVALAGNAAKSVESIEQGFRTVEDRLSALSPVANAVAALRQSVSDLFDPLRKLDKTLSTLHANMLADVATMNDIERIVTTAEHPNK